MNKNCDLKICDFGLARAIDPLDAEKKDLGLTEYVVTRWYRAPELLVENQSYTTAIDVWAVGCIFAEMIGRKALFPGRDYLNQLRLIIDILGTPSEEDLACITNQQAVQFLRTLPVKPRRPWTEVFPKASPQALDLLDSMLIFDPVSASTVPSGAGRQGGHFGHVKRVRVCPHVVHVAHVAHVAHVTMEGVAMEGVGRDRPRVPLE